MELRSVMGEARNIRTGIRNSAAKNASKTICFDIELRQEVEILERRAVILVPKNVGKLGHNFGLADGMDHVIN